MRAQAPAAVLVVLASAAACGRSSKGLPPATVDPASMRAAITRVASYFGKRAVRGDEGWVVTQASTAMGPAFSDWARAHVVLSRDVRVLPDASYDDLDAAEGRLWELRSLPQLPLPPLAPPRAVSAAAPAIEHTDADLKTIGHVMLSALACAHVAPGNRKDVLRDLRPPGHGYVLTHQLVALLLAYDQGCLDRSDVERPRLELATATWREQAADPRLTDLGVERMAILCYARVCEWLDPAWIAALVREQDAGGAWGNRALYFNGKASASDSHTAALAFYVLAQAWLRRNAPGEPPLQPPSD